jgi:hypothetical protein
MNIMPDNQNNDIGTYAKHPMRSAAGSMMIGTVIGAGLMAAKMRRDKTPAQKFLDQFVDRINHMSK